MSIKSDKPFLIVLLYASESFAKMHHFLGSDMPDIVDF